MRTLIAVLRREWWVNTRAYRVSFFASVFMSSLFTLVIGYFLYHVVFDGQVTDRFTEYAGTADYMSFLTLGVLVYTFTDRMLYPVRSFLTEQWEGTLVPMALAGTPRLLYQLGCVLFSALYSLLEVAVLLAVAWFWVGLDLSHMNLITVIACLVATFIGLYGLSVMLSALILHVRDRLVVEGAAYALMHLLSGVAFPVAYLPLPLQWLSQALPLTWALGALRAAVMGGASLAQVAPDLLVLVSLGIGYALVGKWILNRVFVQVLEETA